VSKTNQLTGGFNVENDKRWPGTHNFIKQIETILQRNKQPKTDWPELSAELRAAEEQVMVLCEERRRPSIDWAAIAEELKAGEEICAARAVENATGRR